MMATAERSDVFDGSAIATNLAAVRERIAVASERGGRDPSRVRLVAVCKTFPAEAVVAAYDAGQRDFGENRVQEAVAKIAGVAASGRTPTWHLIGHLQTNKVRAAAESFDMIQSVDSLHLAAALDRRLRRIMPVLVEVNVAGEASKSGFAPEEVCDAVAAIRSLPRLDLRGLMTVAPAVADPEEVRPMFRALADLARREALPELSMGMSADYQVAVEEGATIVRVGTAIFGRRT